MEILQQATGNGGKAEFMQTHPNPEHRMEAIDGWIRQNFPGGVPSSLTQGRPLRSGGSE